MLDFIARYCEEQTKDMQFIVRKKSIYQFEELSYKLDYGDQNMAELAAFYGMCGYKFFEKTPGLSDILSMFNLTRFKTNYNMFPVHNAVAFFSKFQELQSKLDKKQLYFLFRNLLCYALPCYGFVFGSSFFAEGVYCLHPCDLQYTNIPYKVDENNVYQDVLRSQAELQLGRAFGSEKAFYQKTIFALSRQKKEIEEWVQESRMDKPKSVKRYSKPWETDIEKSQKMFWDFFDLYYKYCLSQPGEQDDNSRSRIMADLDSLKKMAHSFWEMERLYRDLEAIRKIKDEQQNIAHKCQWLENAHLKLATPCVQEGFGLMKESKVGPKNQKEEPTLYDLISCQMNYSSSQLKQYPMGKAYDNDVAVKAMLQIRDILLKSDKLKASARSNTVKDFEFAYFDDIDNALIEGLEQNQDFFSMLLGNDEIKKQVLGIFSEEIYNSLRDA